ncbi:MAG: zinc ribbon domain-containing protein [Salinigranum sp.]
MSKITFRADDDLVERVEALDASKSEVMREALRAYLGHDAGAAGPPASGGSEQPLDDLLAARVDELVAERLDVLGGGRDVNVNVTVEPRDGARVTRDESAAHRASSDERGRPRTTPERAQTSTGSSDRRCAQCGEVVEDDHVYCPNCGEKAVRRLFCDCGDELRSDWAYCPSCGRRTPSADVLDG